jgi:glycerol-3-phosphate acyltransferase PlsY
MIPAAAALIAAFLLGSLAWSLWVGRLHGVDLRRHGSGNLGATNVYRVLGWKWGIGVLVLDIAKGTAAVAAARILAPPPVQGALPAAAALAAVAGHMFTPFARFKGGKGVATGLGVFLGLAPEAAVLSFLVWAAVLAFTGWVSVASGVASLLLPLFVVATRDALGPRFPWVLAVSILLAALVLTRHRTNWRRVAAGREQAIWEHRRETPEGGAAPPSEASEGRAEAPGNAPAREPRPEPEEPPR